jgi:hypothetical protein
MKNIIAKIKIGRNNRLIGTKKNKSSVYSVIPVELKEKNSADICFADETRFRAAKSCRPFNGSS